MVVIGVVATGVVVTAGFVDADVIIGFDDVVAEFKEKEFILIMNTLILKFVELPVCYYRSFVREGEGRESRVRERQTDR